MLFNSLPFALFFVALLLLLRVVRRRGEAGILLGASLLFYSMWHPTYLLLLLGAALVNHLLLRWMVRRERSLAVLWLSVGFTLGLLGWFKYAAMLVETALPLLSAGLGLAPAIPDVFLPLGISFYSFQMIALSVDVQQGRVGEVPSFARYLLFVSFFPQLIAGPIVRGRELLPQLAAGGVVDAGRVRSGTWLLLAGLFKKLVMGDFFLAPLVDEVFATPGVAGGGVHLVAMYAFAFQIYFDFSGYTDMARGLARLLGYELPANFREPYLSLDPSEFWRRWHITLSTWFRDYVYIPLGGNRRGEARTRVNLIVVFLLSGLWHGAAWTFVLWGLFHGAWLLLHRLTRGWLARVQPRRRASAGLWVAVRWLVSFHLVAIGFVIFRATSASDASAFLRQVFAGPYELGLPPLEAGLIAASLLLHVAERVIRTRFGRIADVLGARRWGALLEGATAGVVVALALAASGTGGEFIYFQF